MSIQEHALRAILAVLPRHWVWWTLNLAHKPRKLACCDALGMSIHCGRRAFAYVAKEPTSRDNVGVQCRATGTWARRAEFDGFGGMGLLQKAQDSLQLTIARLQTIHWTFTHPNFQVTIDFIASHIHVYR